ncbi:hypothetical protein [Enterocloster lavalensis]|uniref:hypothetical protein n=1 Tax=Enterocloster lavalensis TaxID=460384 RepID=UPI002666592B|nr:hypothetical protein [Enterocloster lavalensis]
MIWETCENLIKSGELKNESWSLREQVLKEIILNEFFDYYGVYDTMNDLMEALCVTKEEKGIFVATKNFYAMSNGSACVSGAYTFSYVLKAMGLDEKKN